MFATPTKVRKRKEAKKQKTIPNLNVNRLKKFQI